VARLLKRRVALLIALATVSVGGTAVALGATASSAPHAARRHAARRHPGTLAAASSYLGLSRSQLLSDLDHGMALGQIAAATPAKSESGLVAALVAEARKRLHETEARLPARIGALVDGQARSAAGTAHHRGVLREAVLAYLGIDRKALAAQLRGGRTLTRIADGTPGRSAAGLRNAILSALRKRLDAQLAAGKLSGPSKARRLSRLETRVGTLMSRSHAAATARRLG
jgi:hypothetical protein